MGTGLTCDGKLKSKQIFRVFFRHPNVQTLLMAGVSFSCYRSMCTSSMSLRVPFHRMDPNAYGK